MARGRDETDLVADPVIGLDEIDEAGIPDRYYRVHEDRGHVRALELVRPMRVLGTAHQITRLWKGRDPTAVDQHCVPPDMIDVEMGADHRVDRLACIVGGCEIREKARLQLVPGRNSPVLLVVAQTGVNDDAAAWRFENERVNAHTEAATLVGEIGLKPGDPQYILIGRLGQNEPAPAGDFELDDLGDRDLADPPLHKRWPGY